jgi:predicted ATP-grasp superfamily ATP-dependent carboligase
MRDISHISNYCQKVSGSHGPRVLVAGDDYYASLATVRGLREAGYEPWFATHSPTSFAGRSRAIAGSFRLPRPTEAGDEAYVAAIADAARSCSAAVVIPGNELATRAFPGREHLFPAETIVASNPCETVERATDKALLARLAAEAGVAAPPTLELTQADFHALRDQITLPAVLKPASTAVSGARGTWIAPPARVVSDAADLEQALAGAPRWLLQRYLEGSLIAVAGVAWRGEVVCSCHQAARRIYPRPLGVSAYAETVPIDGELDEALSAIVRRLGWSGIFEFQLIRSAQGAHVIDLNPRPYGSLALAIGAGLNLPGIWADLLLGREPRIGIYRAGVRYRAEIRELRALVAALTRGRIADAFSIARPRMRTVHSIFSLRDPAPMLAVLERATGKLVKT